MRGASAPKRPPPSRRRGAVTVPSFAKVNLGLEVLGTRTDGHHELRTLFQSVALRDDVLLEPHPQEISVRCGHPAVPLDARNLAWRAADGLRRWAGIRQGVSITLVKRIAVAGGLGGGSSNAASVLLALDRLWRLGLGPSGLHPMARRLGADVPYFLLGGTALGIGRGDEVYPLRRQLKAPLVLAFPGPAVSTASVFARVDRSLTPRDDSHTIFRFISKDLEGAPPYQVLANELEEAALQEAPALAERVEKIRGILIREGAVVALLSGSGSTYFGVFADAARARRAHGALTSAGFRAVRSRTLTFDQYRKVWSRSLATLSRARGWDQGREGHHGDHGRQGHPRR